MNIRNLIVSLVAAAAFLCTAPGVKAQTVKERLTALETAVAALQAENAALQARLNAVEANTALQLNGYVEVYHGVMEGVIGPHVIFGGTPGSGVNVHVQSGNVNGNTNYANGLGNLIIGFNEPPFDMADPTVASVDREGSHNLILGREHKYSSNDSILHGWGATVTAHASAALAADGTIINRSYSAAVGGRDNHIVSRGVTVGGDANVIEGNRSVIVGGTGNRTGDFNLALGLGSVIVGGSNNLAQGDYSAISGGTGVYLEGDFEWCGGGNLGNCITP